MNDFQSTDEALTSALSQRDELLAACKDALEHLEYCNYGDRWEKECAIASGLPGKLYNAIEHATSKHDGLDYRST